MHEQSVTGMVAAAICSFVHAWRRGAELLVAERRSVATVVSVNMTNGRLCFSVVVPSSSLACAIAELRAHHDAKRIDVTKIVQ